MKLHFLDVGSEKYGDCILIEHGGRMILIDGGHSGNYETDGVTPSIPDQLASLMGAAPFEPDLLVITHVHSDHVGCLPQMVNDGSLKPKKVLAADEAWGAGITSESDADPLAGLDKKSRLVAEALLEEGADVADEAEASEFIDSFESTEARYSSMMGQFDPSIVWRFGRDDVSDLESEFAAMGLKFLGPTAEHLKHCAEFIASEKAKAAEKVKDLMASDAEGMNGSTLFWSLIQDRRAENADLPLTDRQGTGSARNNQSIVLMLGAGSKKVLLAGDMQFAKAEVPGLRDSMRALLETVAAKGPFRIIKTTHHTSYNGMDSDELNSLAGDPILIHTGGSNDPSHPEEEILLMLEARLGPNRFARTDRNGLITVNLSPAVPQITLSRGTWNDFTPNPKPAPRPIRRRRPDGAEQKRGNPEVQRTDELNYVEVTARIPHTATRVTITVDISPSQASVVRELDKGIALDEKKNAN